MNLREVNTFHHIFEHLGKPPYKYSGYKELVFTVPGSGICKAGGACDHCGTAIRHAFYFTSADNKKFKVGSQCVNKSGDRGLRKFVSKETNRIKKEKALSELSLLRQHLNDLMTETECKTTKMPHPNKHFAQQGKTLYDYFAFCAKGASNSTTKKLIRTLTKIKE